MLCAISEANFDEVAVAQWLEREVVDLEVVGSNPISHPRQYLKTPMSLV